MTLTWLLIAIAVTYAAVFLLAFALGRAAAVGDRQAARANRGHARRVADELARRDIR
ncbi:MAG: hypothetical protein M3P23_05535 [Actinomycetota bacterium]|nr:hypothetical protein [Actinomycetota bacterium]